MLKTLVLFLSLAFFLPACHKKQERPSPRCIYDQPVLTQTVLQAVQDPVIFANFKQNPFFNLLWENFTAEEGAIWLRKLQEQSPSLMEKWDQVRLLARIGGPRTYSYEKIGTFSPATLRLMAIAADIQNRVENLNGLRVVQIGAGYGGLCKILHDLGTFQSFTLVDLPEQLALAKKCLEQMGIHGVRYATPEELSEENYDLAISDMAFAQFNRTYQKLFFEKALRQARFGYVLGRIFPKHFGVIAWNKEELEKHFEKLGPCVAWEMVEPTIDRENYFIYWKRS
jgi:hypothetical protein